MNQFGCQLIRVSGGRKNIAQYLRTGTERGSNIKPVMAKFSWPLHIPEDNFCSQVLFQNQRRCEVMRESIPQRAMEQQPQALVECTDQSFDRSGSLVNKNLRGTGDDDGQDAVGYQKVASSNLVARCS